MLVTEREDYKAKTDGTRIFPWRIAIVIQNDADILNIDMPYFLSSPSRVADTPWINPGKDARGWWNDIDNSFEKQLNEKDMKYVKAKVAENLHVAYLLLSVIVAYLFCLKVSFFFHVNYSAPLSHIHINPLIK